MTEQEMIAKIAQLEAEQSTLKSTLRQTLDAIKGAVKTDIQETERRMTEFLGDRLADVTNKAKGNSEEISGLKVALYGDKDRTIGLLNEVAEMERKLQGFERLQEEWAGVSGSEEKPGAASMLNKLWLDHRDRSTRSKTFQAIGAGGGITFLVIAFNLISGAIEKSSSANAAKAAATEAKVSEVRSFFFGLDKTSAVNFKEIQKDIEFLKGKK